MFVGFRAVVCGLVGWLSVAPVVRAAEDPAGHWAFQPVVEPAVPPVRNLRWVRTTVDRFILARLEADGLTPSPSPRKSQLLRRVTLDLTGLPPTPAELERFVADLSPQAFAREVERLLESPRYGERWGRWWLDVARYADSNGQDENKFMANAWRYRDWVIRAFNRDLPFDQFVTQQLAGDLLPTDGAPFDVVADQWAATGFLVVGPKMLAEQDKPKMVMDLVDEQIDTIGRAFLGLTVSCSRCHDHKFDPIPTRDYYALAGILHSTRSMENLGFVSKWNERSIATPEHRRALSDFVRRTNEVAVALAAKVKQADQAAEATWRERTGPTNKAAQANLTGEERRKLWPDALAKEVNQLEAERSQLLAHAPPVEPLVPAVAEGAVTNLPVHLRGSHLNLDKDPVPRGFIRVLGTRNAGTIPSTQSGRLQLAQWLTHPQNPLLARVTVNRIWQAHFGEGLVRTADNFGLKGERPSHPELLDWLALEFMKGGWSVKAIHRLILNSAVYQQTSERTGPMPEGGRGLGEDLDPDNRLLARFPRQRMEAEMVRDSLLAVAGTLDLKMGGSLASWKNDEYVPGDEAPFASNRRSVYLPILRDRVYDVLSLFDFANPSVGTARRGSTVVSHQALFFMNSPLVKGAARELAQRSLSGAALSDTDRLGWLYRQTLGRAPRREELRRSLEFVATAPANSSEDRESRLQRYSAFVQVLLSSNEFVYRD